MFRNAEKIWVLLSILKGVLYLGLTHIEINISKMLEMDDVDYFYNIYAVAPFVSLFWWINYN